MAVSRITIINLGLALLAGFFLFKTIQVWQTDASLTSHQQIAAPDQQHKAADPKKKEPFATQKRPVSKSVYQEITAKNLFALDRQASRPVKVKEEPVSTETLKVDGRKIALFGIMLLDDQQSALINNPDPKAEGRKMLWIKTGDRVGNLKVEAISAQSVVFTDGSKKYQVDLYDQNKRRTGRVSVQKETPVVVTAPSVIKKSPTPKAVSASSPKDQPEDGYEIVSTPFGPTKIKKKK